jgi:3-phosphoglycerate kinase
VAKRTIRDLKLQGQRVFIRVDFNVPLKNGVIGDDTRVRSSLPTIEHALAAGAACVVLASHLGRPKGKPNTEMSLRPVAARLAELLGRPVLFAEDCVGPAAESVVASAPSGSVVLLENLRFHAEEEKNDPAFAKGLAALADVYVNDAFGAAHRAHASVEALVHLMPQAGAGLLMERELLYLLEALREPKRPFVAVLGGAKVSDKIEVIDNLIPRIDRLIIGGAMAYTFFKAMGKPVGGSLVEDDKLDSAREVLAQAKSHGLQLLLPTDHVVAPKLEAGAGALGRRSGHRDTHGARHRARHRAGLCRGADRCEDGRLERSDGRLRDRRLRAGYAQRRKSRGGGAGHDHRRRRRLDSGDCEGRRDGPHHPHLHRRRRVARMPRRPHPARRRRAARGLVARYHS